MGFGNHLLSQNKFPTYGYVGIGTDSPSRILHVYGAGQKVLFGDPNHSSSPSLQFFTGHNDGYNYIQSGGSSAIGNIRITKFETSNQNIENFQIYSNKSFFNGNVGIGTANPTQALDLQGNFRISGNTLFGMSRNTGNGIYFFRDGGASSSGGNSWGLEFKDVFDTGKHLFGLKTNGELRLTLTGNGNVGIGTTTPDSKLSVNGTIHSKEVRVDMNSWPDYVFEKEYTLPSLREVELFIKREGHLEGVPSAEEVKMDGLMLGEMEAKLLQKIEELTLYIIRLEKRLNIHEKQIKHLRK